MKKKFFLVISTVMMLGLFAGCGKETDTNSSTPTVASAGTTATNGTSAETTATNDTETAPADPGQELAISTEQHFIEGYNPFGDGPITVKYNDPYSSERHYIEAEVIYRKGEGSVSISKTVNLLNDLAQKQGYTEVDFTTMTVDEFKEWFNNKFDMRTEELKRGNAGDYLMVTEQNLLDALSVVPDLNKNYIVNGNFNILADIYCKNSKGDIESSSCGCLHIRGFEEVVPTEAATPTPTPYEALY